MTTPTCPDGYSCTFTLTHPHVITKALNPWWQLTAGWIVALTAVLVLGAVLAYLTARVMDLRAKRETFLENSRQRDAERQHELAIEEQRTMQADMAKGDPDMLRLIRQR